MNNLDKFKIIAERYSIDNEKVFDRILEFSKKIQDISKELDILSPNWALTTKRKYPYVLSRPDAFSTDAVHLIDVMERNDLIVEEIHERKTTFEIFFMDDGDLEEKALPKEERILWGPIAIDKRIFSEDFDPIINAYIYNSIHDTIESENMNLVVIQYELDKQKGLLDRKRQAKKRIAFLRNLKKEYKQKIK